MYTHIYICTWHKIDLNFDSMKSRCIHALNILNTRDARENE